MKFLQALDGAEMGGFAAVPFLNRHLETDLKIIHGRIWTMHDYIYCSNSQCKCPPSVISLCVTTRLYFALAFWNQTCRTRFDSPVLIESCLRSFESGLWLRAKYVFMMRSWCCLNDVRTRFVFVPQCARPSKLKPSWKVKPGVKIFINL